MTDELSFLRYFYDRAGDYMGPADCEIYDMIKKEFKAEYGKIPYDYDDLEEDWDEDMEPDPFPTTVRANY